MRRIASRSQRAGFTLIEALLATLLMAIIMGALAQMTSQWLRSWDRGFTRIQSVDLLAVGLDRLVEDGAAAGIGSSNEHGRSRGASGALRGSEGSRGVPSCRAGLERAS